MHSKYKTRLAISLAICTLFLCGSGPSQQAGKNKIKIALIGKIGRAHV